MTYLCAGASLLIAVLAVWPGRPAPGHASGTSSNGPAGLHRSSLSTTQDISTTGSPTENATSTAATPTGDGTYTTAPDTDVIDWSGRVRLSTDLDLDGTPVQPAGFGDLHLEGKTKATFAVRTAPSTKGSTLWNSKADPSKAQCDEKVRTDQDAPGTSWVKWTIGDAMCIITNGGQDAFLRVVAIADNGITFHVIRWL